jgi:hypothetical protein
LTVKNITLTAEASVIDAARERARAENTTVNEQFRRWLASYAHADASHRYEQAMKNLRGRLVVGRKLTRDQRNER